MKIRIASLLATALLACVAVCHAGAQSLSSSDESGSHKIAASYAFDPLDKGKPTQVVRYTATTFHDVLGHSGVDVDLDGLLAVGSQLRIGTALTHTWHLSFALSKEIRPKLDLTAGPWTNYGTSDGRLRGGLFLGLGGRF